jgi:cell division protein FtsB
MKVLPKIFSFLRNKFVLATLFFVLWILFFDHNNFFQYRQYKSELNELTNNKKYYKEQIEMTKKEIELIKTSPSWLEKIARENYLMKREGEDIFVVKEE